jgi:hypothetical protein
LAGAEAAARALERVEPEHALAIVPAPASRSSFAIAALATQQVLGREPDHGADRAARARRA